MTELSRIQYRTDTNWPMIKPSAIFSMLLLYPFLEYPQEWLNSSESYGNLWRTVFEITNVVTRNFLAHTPVREKDSNKIYCRILGPESNVKST